MIYSVLLLSAALSLAQAWEVPDKERAALLRVLIYLVWLVSLVSRSGLRFLAVVEVSE